MLIKYQTSCDSNASVAEICRVTRDEDKIILIPACAGLACIEISGVSSLEYDNIITELFRNGKADLTQYKSQTCKTNAIKVPIYNRVLW